MAGLEGVRGWHALGLHGLGLGAAVWLLLGGSAPCGTHRQAGPHPAARPARCAAADACKKLQEMFGAGFKREQSVAALILARGNLEQAADMCLAAGEH